MAGYVIGVDVGGTNIRAALCNAQGQILKQHGFGTLAAEGPEIVFQRIVKAIREVLGNSSHVGAIALGAPGPLNPWNGVILEAPNLPGMIDFPMKGRLEAEFGLPAFIGNDANLAALGEHRYGAGRGVRDMVYMTISTGIGGGIIADGELYLGWRGFAGEVGHQTLEAHGPLCNCGNIGCLEALASGPAIARSARDALKAGRESALRSMAQDPEKVTTALVAQAAQQGDALARELFERAGYYVGLGIINLEHILDTEFYVLGGGVATHAWDLFYPSMLATIDRYTMPAMRKGVRVVQAQLGEDVGLVGAAALALDSIAAPATGKA